MPPKDVALAFCSTILATSWTQEGCCYPSHHLHIWEEEEGSGGGSIIPIHLPGDSFTRNFHLCPGLIRQHSITSLAPSCEKLGENSATETRKPEAAKWERDSHSCQVCWPELGVGFLIRKAMNTDYYFRKEKGFKISTVSTQRSNHCLFLSIFVLWAAL